MWENLPLFQIIVLRLVLKCLVENIKSIYSYLLYKTVVESLLFLYASFCKTHDPAVTGTKKNFIVAYHKYDWSVYFQPITINFPWILEHSCPATLNVLWGEDMIKYTITRNDSVACYLELYNELCWYFYYHTEAHQTKSILSYPCFYLILCDVNHTIPIQLNQIVLLLSVNRVRSKYLSCSF